MRLRRETVQQIRDRLAQHIENPVKRAAFSSVLVTALKPGADSDTAERVTADMTGPFLGTKLPTRNIA